MSTDLSLLFPTPQHLELAGASFTVPDEPVIDLVSPLTHLRTTADRLKEALQAYGRRPRQRGDPTRERGSQEPEITLRLDRAVLPHVQSYRLVVEDGGISVIGVDEAGLFYGTCTLIQLMHLHAPATAKAPFVLPGVRIDDWPDFLHRGVMLDVSRDKVPTMETLFSLVDLLASWKINQVQLYLEHTFAYRGHEVAWQHASPFTGTEIEALDAFCRERHVELVPNQNSFGHMHRWLIHEPYRQLAECPEGFSHPFSPQREPYGLCPTDPGSLTLLTDLYEQLLPHFSSRQFNVGLDETFDLGYGRSAEVCAAKGIERVYLDFLREIHRLVSRHGRTMQCWGDVLRQRPELLSELPKDVIVLEWGYEADHPFFEHCRLFAAAGLRVYVCPGTSSWNSLGGRTDNALSNICRAAEAGHRTGAAGFLTTDWGDNGHLQSLPVSYLGLLAGAGMSWCRSDAANPRSLNMPMLLDVHAFRDQAQVMGRVAYDLGNAYLLAGARLQNGSALFHLLVFADRDLSDLQRKGLTVETLDRTRTYIDGVMAPLQKARMARPDAEDIMKEFAWVADILRLACRLGMARLRNGLHTPVGAIPVQTRTGLAAELRGLIERHQELWRRRNRPGGLIDSAVRLEQIVALLEA